jgi:hypothetical protein
MCGKSIASGSTDGHGPLDDFDRDGIVELIEQGLALDPVTPNANFANRPRPWRMDSSP